MKFPLFPLIRVVGVALVLAVSGIASAHAADATHVVRIGYQKGTPYTLLKAQGTLEKRLAPLGYSVSWTEFPAGPQLIEAMDVGSIDLGYTGAPPPIFAQAAQKHVLYLAAEPAGKQNEAILVRPDSPIHSVADLKGHTVAFQRGSSSHYLLLASLEKAGLRISDIQPVSLTPADARAAFEAGKVDAWVIWDPYLAVAQRSVPTRVLADWGQGLVQPHGFFLGSPAFAAEHADLVHVVFEEVAKSDQWAATHQDEAVQLFASQIGVDRPTVTLFLSRSRFGIVPVDDEITSIQQTIADAFYAEKVLPSKIHVADIVWKGTTQAVAH
ncbi:sulfonate ABC transporter substrate-binding protein [Pararobbsia alpina]|uniref:sulfonate ABC transporter substrate-binding protein n=1 Tax=Pararobbsia alpina TaxID=621374 RepID=UPI0039A46223